MVEKIDKYGKWLIDEQGNSMLIEPTEDWKTEKQNVEIPSETLESQDYYLLDLDFRISIIELGI